MNRWLLLLFFIITGSSAGAQCLTSSLIINTGYNPITGVAIAGGANGTPAVRDPHWIVNAISAATSAAIAATPGGYVAVVPGNSADIVTPVGSAWVTNPTGNPGNWISCLNSNTYNDQGTGLPYDMTLGRPFRMCTDDTIMLSFYVSSDNTTPAADIDGTITLTAPVTGFSGYTLFTQKVWLTAGTHTIHFVVNNQNVASLSSNPTGLNIYGTVSSATGTNSIVSERYASCSTYTCGGTCNTLSLPDSLHFCQSGSDTLRATVIGSDSIISIAWTPVAGLSSSTVLRPLLTVSTPGWHVVTIKSITPYNLVTNGDFSAGNTGFTSTYAYKTGANSLQPEATYAITTNPLNVHTGAVGFGDHTTGTGNMMVINGSSTPTSVWCQTIPVTPNTDYAFSAWAAIWSTVSTGAAAPILQFLINGVLIGTPDTINSAAGTWSRFYATWNSGTNTTATICIYDECTALNGNDFALDDIGFQQMCIAKDSIYVAIAPVDTTYTHQDTNVCASATAITLTGPAGYSPYLWNTGSSGSSVSVGGTGVYWVYASGNCAMLIDTFYVSARPLPPAPVTRDTFYCQNFGSPAQLTEEVETVPGTLNWYLGGSLLPGTPVPSTAIPTYPGGTTWYVSQTVNGCEGPQAPVNIIIIAKPDFTIVAQPWVCQFDSISLAYSGSPLLNGSFLWQLSTGATIANGTSLTDSVIVARFDSVHTRNYVYLTVSNLGGQCFTIDTTRIQIIELPTATAFSKADVCLSDTVGLALSSISPTAQSFVWVIDHSPLFSSDALTIIASNSNSGGPFSIRWTDTGTHIIHVQASTEHGCLGKPTSDTVNVHALPDATFRITTNSGPLCLEDSVLFSANDSNYQNNYRWEPEHFFRSINAHAVWGRVEQKQSIVTLTVTDPFGCAGSGSRELDPGACCNIVFPNAFTPNGDGYNDVFRAVPMQAFHRYHVFRIVNRWGQTVFESTNNKAQWDGTFNGVPQDMDVYFYYLKYDCDGKTIEQKGDVTLVR